jgi:aspartate/methionine/tyrosine aminotransferase
MAKFRALRNYAGPQVPLPLMAASAAAWSDEIHVAANRAHYVERFALAERLLGSRAGFRLPEGGFFLWLEVGDGARTALELWREGGVRVLPGAFMGRESDPGKPRTNPGFPYIRVALVNDLSTIMKAFERMVEILGSNSR